MKIFTTIGKVLDEAIEKGAVAFDKATDEVVKKAKESRIHVESKKKFYDTTFDTTTVYTRYTTNGETKEKITVNGKEVDPQSEQGKKIKDRMQKSEEKREEAFTVMNKGFEAMEKGFDIMEKAFDQMEKSFDKIDRMFE